ncbi:uncharacterized protein LOC125055167 isoform X1 [Pieris napi]|uniref:uncharacterized protein LOC125055167 isoform X1 n=1 Tax=Pieris napi TaxID=78633 RepID=UPI001FBB076C|nr:uncharacterized protein LOC125055167 isoform X1 [Pieris napi]XP_047513409.1 uncharacterized protein LOC125055167 isoform X1 [Pieris napi]
MNYGMPKVWYRSRRNQVVILVVIVFSLLYYVSLNNTLREPNLDLTRSSSGGVKQTNVAKLPVKDDSTYNLDERQSVAEYIEKRLENSLREDKNSGCEIPKLDPFAPEVTKFDKDLPKIVCYGVDWVKCYLDECKVVPEILRTTRDIICTYNDILYESDAKYTIGPSIEIRGADVYPLIKSDHVKVKCTGTHENSILPSKWLGHGIGFRSTVHPKTPPPGRENTYDILFLGFDSTAKNGFIRRMPKSYKVVKEILGATVLNSYNIVGDGTPAALFPFLTGKTELELPDVRKKTKNNDSLDNMPFIFYRLKDDGYRTAYFEDMPWIGTFQYRFKGFVRQPADHYLRAFYLEESQNGKKWGNKAKRYCVGDTPQFELMLNITDQFFKLDGKKFGFTFIADITHDDFNMIPTADDALAAFLTDFMEKGRGKNTMLLLFGDHGPRYAYVRDTLQGKFEERLPLMAIRLPDDLVKERPDAQKNLERNAEVLTTPHDIHATILDVMDMRKEWNPYKIKGADLTRGLTILEPISSNRSCSEAGIEPHWCSCLSWEEVVKSDPMFTKTGKALVDFINSLTDEARSKCVPRTLQSVQWSMRKRPNNGVLTFVAAKDMDGYVGKFGKQLNADREDYTVKITVNPNNGVYEGSLIYYKAEDRFEIDSRDISRINAYNNEPSCISATLPHLNMYCFCKEFL